MQKYSSYLIKDLVNLYRWILALVDSKTAPQSPAYIFTTNSYQFLLISVQYRFIIGF